MKSRARGTLRLMKPTGVLDALGDLVFTLDCDQRVTAAYGTGFDTGRYKKSQFIGKTIADDWPADMAALHVHMNARALEGQCVVYDWEFPMPGSGHRFMTILAPLYGQSGEVIGALRISRELGDDVRSVATQTLQLALQQPKARVGVKTGRGRDAGRPATERTLARTSSPRKIELSAEITKVIHQLSARERLVVGLLVDSARTSQIARELDISIHTVRHHLKHILRKAGVHSQQELLEFLRGKRRR